MIFPDLPEEEGEEPSILLSTCGELKKGVKG
jgi:hypothetical protein